MTWGKFAARAGALDAWLSGKSVLDPSMGRGALLTALVESALEAGHRLDSLPFHSLFGIEIDPAVHSEALGAFQSAYGVDMSARFVLGDVFETEPFRCDVILGNPPWMNFSDLPDGSKTAYRTRFLRSGLAPQSQKLLLGNSRIDVAALFVQKTVADFLVEGGQAWFFLPLSLFLNDAHSSFRAFSASGVRFRPMRVLDFQKTRVFDGISTRVGFAAFQRNAEPTFPIPYQVLERGFWKARWAGPETVAGSWRVGEQDVLQNAAKPRVSLERRSLPRQGINTGGANGVFFFDSCVTDGDSCVVNGSIRLPPEFVYPLLTATQFRDVGAPAEKWVLVPHDTRGRPLSAEVVAAHPLLRDYLERHRAVLTSRRGTFIAGLRNRGFWWALLGVGPYNFAPFKVVWEAAGRRTFSPRLCSGTWQVNQSLQCYIPCWSESEARRILGDLENPAVASFLESLGTGGTLSWAQPGSVKKVVEIRD